ncbi:hypothetical protein E5161_13005 [Cohnella pontilimi]|uniref:Luciferase domain-containing protein n=1 Tax=Cohnella pontilimi TaxID=2564100 RepID=A0A4U0F9G8_9BACL|nr:luciferase family protein [Cohnella pontilimi]TJY41337.1 hypothetical protein E5161_13005 [Cohnella pontilimi]
MAKTDGPALVETVRSWPGVSLRPHRFGGTEFVVNGKEIGHMHGNRLFDLLLSKSERDRWIEEGKASPHHIYPDSGWVSVYLKTEQDIACAIEIARFKYDQIKLKGRRT